MNPEQMGGLSEKDKAMMGLDQKAETSNSEQMSALRQEAEQAMIAAFGSKEEAQRYAAMELTQQVLHPNPDAGIEEGLADKIGIARNFTGALELLENADHPTEGSRFLDRARSSLDSAKTSQAFARLSKRN
jgi:hypothetical protein